jgi:hypothetical protein
MRCGAAWRHPEGQDGNVGYEMIAAEFENRIVA